MHATTLLERTRIAAEVHAATLTVPDDATIDQCRDLCNHMGLCPDELCSDSSKSWSTLQILHALKGGKASLSFRGHASRQIAAQVTESASRQI